MPVFIAPFFTGEKDSTLTAPPCGLWKNSDTAAASAVYLKHAVFATESAL